MFLGKANYPKMKIYAISPQRQQALGQYSKNMQSELDQTSHIKFHKTETGIFAAE